MQLLTSLYIHHDVTLVALAALVCVSGAIIFAQLYMQCRGEALQKSVPWNILTGGIAGLTVWSTHFVAMLGFRPDQPTEIEIWLTLMSLVVAVLGCTAGVALSKWRRVQHRTLVGGVVFASGISSMHYLGMSAYMSGDTSHETTFVAASILFAMILSVACIHFGTQHTPTGRLAMPGLFVLAVVSLHFLGMAGYSGTHAQVAATTTTPEHFNQLAIAVAIVTSLILLVGLLIQISEVRTRRAHIAELTEARNAAEQANTAKTEFLSILSHELLTPLTVMQGYGHMVRKLGADMSNRDMSDGGGSAEQEQFVRQAEFFGTKITHAGDQLLTLINEILDFSTMERGELGLEKQEFFLPDLLAEMQNTFSLRADKRNATIQVSAPRLYVQADKKRCTQLLMNLISNAVKFSGASEITLSAARSGETLVLEVADNGCGIPSEDLDRIFDAFTQLEPSRNRREGGLGLGLAICRKIVAAHGGQFSVESTPEEGTRFKATFPKAVRVPEGQDQEIAA